MPAGRDINVAVAVADIAAAVADHQTYVGPIGGIWAKPVVPWIVVRGKVLPPPNVPVAFSHILKVKADVGKAAKVVRDLLDVSLNTPALFKLEVGPLPLRVTFASAAL